jgi:hypothetical protein
MAAGTGLKREVSANFNKKARIDFLFSLYIGKNVRQNNNKSKCPFLPLMWLETILFSV